MWSGMHTSWHPGDSLEHIIPECIGGKRTLPPGYVSNEWNGHFSDLDKEMKYGHPLMMYSYQKDPRLIGKKKGGKDARAIRERRSIQKSCIEGGPTKVTRCKETGNTSFIDADFLGYRDKFVRSLHKCFCNILCNYFGPHFMRINCKELLDFVMTGDNCHNWSYALSIHRFFSPLCISPEILPIIGSRDNSGAEIYYTGFIHTSGIWMGSSHPNGINKSIIEQYSDVVLSHKPLVQQVERISGKEFKGLFGFHTESWRSTIGKLGFYWIKKPIKGTSEESEFFHLLTTCKLCGQVTPTGIMLMKDLVVGTDYSNGTYPINSWNTITEHELKARGVRGLSSINGSLLIPKSGSVENLKISNCKCACINCSYPVDFDAKDCFV